MRSTEDTVNEAGKDDNYVGLKSWSRKRDQYIALIGTQRLCR